MRLHTDDVLRIEPLQTITPTWHWTGQDIINAIIYHLSNSVIKTTLQLDLNMFDHLTTQSKFLEL